MFGVNQQPVGGQGIQGILQQLNQLGIVGFGTFGFPINPAGQANPAPAGNDDHALLDEFWGQKINKTNYMVENTTLEITDDIDLSKYKISKNIDNIILTGGIITGKHQIPEHIKHFINCNKEFDVNGLSNSIEILEIKNDKINNINYTHKLDNLPNKLIRLNIEFGYNLPIENLPNSLKYLSIKKYFNQIVDNLPDGLEYLNLGDDFNQPINNLPSSLKILILGRSFCQTINNLPNGLKKLEINNIYKQHIQNLPNLEDLQLFCHIDLKIDLPETLKNLKAMGICAPDALEIFKQGGLCEYRNFLQMIANSNCQNLKKLLINYYHIDFYDNNYFNDIPQGIEELEFEPVIVKSNEAYNEQNDDGDDENIFIENYKNPIIANIDFTLLPSSIKKLVLNNVKYKCKFPNTLTHLTLIRSSIIDFNVLPDSLVHLEIDGIGAKNKIYIDKLPLNLELLICRGFKISNLSEIKLLYPNLKIVTYLNLDLDLFDV